MKFQVLLALVGMSKALELSEMMNAQQQADLMEASCKEVEDVQIHDADDADSLVELDTQEDAAETTDLEVDDTDLAQLDADNEEGKNTKGSYYKHYGRSKKAIDQENHYILSTQKKCLKFV